MKSDTKYIIWTIAGLVVFLIVWPMMTGEEESDDESGDFSGNSGADSDPESLFESGKENALSYYPIASGPSGFEYDMIQKHDIKSFLSEVQRKIAEGLEPADAWKHTKSRMYVIDNKVELLENDMLLDNSTHCDDGDCCACNGGSGYSVPGGGSALICKNLLNRHVPTILAMEPCSQRL